MSNVLSKSEVETLKSRFRAAGCRVTDLNDESFEIAASDFPLRTHVLVNPYYVQLATFIFGNPRGSLPNSEDQVYEYLNVINRNAKLVKFTLEDAVPDEETQCWPFYASVRFVTGVAGGDYGVDALKNLVLLWCQDIAELMASPGDFELHAMMRGEDDKE